MLKTLFVAAMMAMVAVTAIPASAQNLLETTEQARQRHAAERYQYQQRNGTPLGGYPEKLGDPAPPGTPRPGFTSPSYGGSTFGSSNNSLDTWGQTDRRDNTGFGGSNW